ncbi:alkene reductase [Alkalihalobacterium alkalinitrilicum]|uniref:oxidoreductase n=1 Tax=Alkalihalobacterium alkalinitrilicum TaxID=427920 RepID=UPI0009958786
MNQTTTKLFEPVTIGAWELRTRTAMAPLTRCFADDETGEVGPDVVEYYRKRAADGIGLIITEGIIISPLAKGYPRVSGLYTQSQVEAWKKVTDAVHAEGGKIIAQIWHVGRISHKGMTGGLAPQAPSAIKAEGIAARSKKPYDEPKEMSSEEIQEVIKQFSQAARNAISAGFDGVEIHGAHGYLIDQFNSEITNTRTDRYGGDLSQRLTFMKEVIAAVIDVVGVDRTLVRFSAHKVDNVDYMWEEPEKAVETFIEAFKEVGLKMIHPSILNFNRILENNMNLYELVRKYWDGFIFGVGDLDIETAEDALNKEIIDVAVFGRPLISNPVFLKKVRNGEELEPYIGKVHLKTLV